MSENKDKLDLVAKALLKYETLNAEEYLKAYNGELDLSDEEEVKEESTIDIVIDEKNEIIGEEKETLPEESASSTGEEDHIKE